MEPSKRCVTCGVVQPLTGYSRRLASADGRQARCRTCAREWYVANRERHMANVRRRNDRVRQENQALLEQHLRLQGCVDCGERDVRVLDLDHEDREDKLDDVSRLVGSSLPWARIAAEIAKCSVRCANCHRRRTAEQLGYWRQAAEVRRRDELAADADLRLRTVLGLTP